MKINDFIDLGVDAAEDVGEITSVADEVVALRVQGFRGDSNVCHVDFLLSV